MKPPRISAFPKCYLEDIVEGRMDVFEWVAMSESLGAEGLEMYTGFLRPAPGDDGYLRRLRAAIESTGQVCSLMCFSADFTHPDRAAREEALEAQKRAIDATIALGGSCCRILSGQRRPEVSRQAGVDWVVEAIERALEYAAPQGIVLAMENHYKDGAWRYPEFAQKMDVFLEIVSRVESPHFGVQYDPSNAVVAGDDPIELLEAVKHRVVSMHASDRYLVPGTSLDDMREADGSIGYPANLLHGVTGKGLNDYDAILRILRSVDFQGWISIEDGMNGMDEMKASIEFLERKLADHYGAA